MRVRLEESAQMTNISNLIVWEVCLVKVSAFNSKNSVSSDPVCVRTLEGFLIKAHLNIRANAHNSIQVTWNAPLTQFVNILIQRYKLSMLENNLPGKRQTHLIDVPNPQGPRAGYSSTPSTRSAFSPSPTPTTDRPPSAYK